MSDHPQKCPSAFYLKDNQQQEETNGESSGDFCAPCISQNLMKRQLALEEEMLTQGRARWLHNVQAAKERHSEATTSYGHMLLKRGVEPLAAAIQGFQERAVTGRAGRRHAAVGLLAGISPEVAAFVSLRKALDRMTTPGITMQAVAVDIARALELEKKILALRDQDNPRYKMTKRHIQGHNSQKYRRTVLNFAFGKSGTVAFRPWSKPECLHLGQKMLELIMETTGIFHLVRRPMPGRHGVAANDAYMLELAPSCRDWLKRHRETAGLMYPDYLPTIVPPKPWRGAGGGGYYSLDEVRPLSLVKVADMDYQRDLDRRIQNGELPVVLTAVNAMQNTAWSINEPVLETARQIWDVTGGDVAGLPKRDGWRLPPCPICGADITDSASAYIKHGCLDTLCPEELADWKRAALRIHEKNVANNSRRLTVAKILTLAERFKREDHFYYPYQLDFRGRIYAVPSYLNPQGTDLAKGLLRFSEGKALGDMKAVRWLAIHGSNTWGNDKVSLDERHSWVLEQQERILAVAADPLADGWWMEADAPFCFLAFCFEWAGYVREGLSFCSRLPIALDGTCNGLQIYSLMLRDAVGGHAVNLTPTKTPQDIYGIVAEKVRAALLHDAEHGGPVQGKKKDADGPLYDSSVCARVLLKLGIDRKTTKRQVMVLPYGGTNESCREYTKEWLTAKLDGRALPDGLSLRRLNLYLSGLIWEAIGATVIKAREAMTFLQETALILAKLKHPLRWTSPTGLPVLQRYMDAEKRRVKTQLGDALIYLTLHEEKQDTLNVSKQRSAVAPNVVHSLDASALMFTVRDCLRHGVGSFAMIHDSYGTHAAHTETLAATLRDVFVRLFGGNSNMLALWLREVSAVLTPRQRATLQTPFPTVPTMGSLDVEEVRNSLFFFA